MNSNYGNVQVLVATMDQMDYSIVNRMHLNTDSIICNQCNKYGYSQIESNGNVIEWFDFDERGVGLNRNNALMRAKAKYSLFSDDDLIYYDNYDIIINEAFNRHPDADVIIFNLENMASKKAVTNKDKRVRWYNYFKYGTARLCIKTESIKQHGIYFNQCFGGGTEHRHGEDTLFLTDCLRKGLKIYAVTDYIAVLTECRKSTWNVGYDSKFFYDQGILYREISNRLWILLCLQDSIRHRGIYHQSIIKTFLMMVFGEPE